MSWRAKLGIIYPADGALDHEYWALVPGGVSVHITRIPIPTEDQTVEALRAQTRDPHVEQAAVDLNTIRLDAIAYACTSGSFLHGLGGDLEIIRRMETASGVPCTTTTTAVVRALNALGSRRLSVVTPYPDEVNERFQSFLEESGFRVVSLQGLGLNLEIYNQPPGAAYRLAREADRDDADAVLVSCTNFRSAEILRHLEQDLGKPVVTANQATMWDLLRLAGFRHRDARYGRLYRLETQ